MSSNKAVLRAINDSIRQSNFDDVLEKAGNLLEKDPKNHQALIFLAFALDKQNRKDEAEKAYLTAAALRPQDSQAYQGLIKLYEQQGSKKLAGYYNSVVSLAKIFHNVDDMYKCQDVVDHFIDYARIHGNPPNYADALSIRLPDSPLYSILEGRFPPPGQTYETIARILDEYETKRVNSLVGERRTRLGAKLADVTLEAKREVYQQSKLEHVYNQLINWTSDDDVRRTYEEKLLRYCYERLLALPPNAKDLEQAKVLKLAKDMVVINHPFKLAWDIAINWQDNREIIDWDPVLLRQYCKFFPDSDLCKVISAYMSSSSSPFPAAEGSGKDMAGGGPTNGDLETSSDEEDEEEGGVSTSYQPLTDEERLSMMTEDPTASESVLAYRLVGDFLLRLEEHDTAVDYMRRALTFLDTETKRTGYGFEKTRDAFTLCLATALVYYQSPRHHAEAKNLFEEILKKEESSTQALIGVGLIFEEEEELDQAIDFFDRALQRDRSNIRIRSEAAWVRAMKGEWRVAKDDLLDCIEPLEKQGSVGKVLLADVQYRIGWCLWNLDSSPSSRKERKGECAYAYWLSALRNNLDHAAAYTSLGIYYSDYAKDCKRARRCFQKALELSAGELVAAERLSRAFATDGDWDRVELVAQRVVDSGKVKPPPGSKKKGVSWPFAALGVAELNKREYHKAIVSFQAALRLQPGDYHSWVGLGESYFSSGRYMAATKAIVHAQSLEAESKNDVSGDKWFTQYMLANIKRELGDFDESIDLYRSAMKDRPDEQGVVTALMQTMADSALACVDKGFFGKAVELATDMIFFAASVNGNIRETLNFWKAIGDGCSVFSSVQSRVADFPTQAMNDLIQGGRQEAFDLLSDMDGVGTDLLQNRDKDKNETEGEPGSLSDLIRCLDATILCQKQAIYVSSGDIHAQAVARYNLGWAEHRAHECLSPHRRMRRRANGYMKAAIRAFKQSIELESGNGEFWNALGVATSGIKPSVAQHAFVRSLHLNERNPATWTNLGSLALMAGDINLAKQVYTRAQSVDPDYAQAWLGQGFVALRLGDEKEARTLFAHAMEVAEASLVPARRQYAASVLDEIVAKAARPSLSLLLQPLFALEQARSLQPRDVATRHMSALFQERIGDWRGAVKTLEKVCDDLEAEYEKRESGFILGRFALARTDLARAYLAAGSHDKAVECGEMTLGLSSEVGGGELTKEQRNKSRLSAHLTVGLAQFYLGRFKEAEVSFRKALQESDEKADAASLLACVLWAQGSDSSREQARATLFGVVEEQANHVQSVLLLGVVALLDRDQGSLEAVVEELEGLRTKDGVMTAEQRLIGDVLSGIAGAVDDGISRGKLAQAQVDIMLFPHLAHGWTSLARTTGDGQAAQMALEAASRDMPPRGLTDAEELSEAYAGTGLAADSQRAIFLAPWERAGWRALDEAVAGSV